jgi:hypothetical protein
MTFRELAQLYAIRAREFSETVARLGQIEETGPDLMRLLREINRRRALCSSAAEELDRYVVQKETNLSSKSATADALPDPPTGE